MINMEIVTTIIASFGGLGLCFAGIGYGWGHFKRGSDEVDSKLIAQQKEYIVALESRNLKLSDERTNLINTQQEQLTSLNKQIGVLQGRLEEQSKKLEEYKELIKGRDPQMLQVLNEIKRFMEALASDSVINRTRNKKIDVDTEKVEGKILRKTKG